MRILIPYGIEAVDLSLNDMYSLDLFKMVIKSVLQSHHHNWLHYLNLIQSHGDVNEFLSFCATLVEFAANQHLRPRLRYEGK